MKITLIKNSKVIGKVTPTWAILHNDKYVCGGKTQHQALTLYCQPNTLGTLHNCLRLGQYRKAAKMLTS